MSTDKSKYDGLSHAKLSIVYHIVLCTKYRRACLGPVREDLQEYARDAFADTKIEVLEVGVDNDDHMHVLLRVRNPRLSIGQIVRKLKSYTTVRAWKEHAYDLQKTYWKKRWNGHLLWSNGYFAATVGNDFETVSKYVQNQK